VKLDGIDIDGAIKNIESALKQEENLSPALKSMINILIMVVKLLTNRMGLNSKNSSKPPSTDHKPPKNTRKKSTKKTGGQNGHVGTTLRPVDEPDEIEIIKIDRRSLPKGHRYQEVGFEKRQVFDMDISRIVTEYQAQVLEDDNS